MTKEECRIVAEAQAAYQRAMRNNLKGERLNVLYRLGVLGLLEAELQVEHEDTD